MVDEVSGDVSCRRCLSWERDQSGKNVQGTAKISLEMLILTHVWYLLGRARGRIHIEPLHTTIPISSRVFIPKGTMLPMTSWP